MREPSQRKRAKEHVVQALSERVADSLRIKKLWDGGGFARTYRREINRLFRVALRAVREDV